MKRRTHCHRAREEHRSTHGRGGGKRAWLSIRRLCDATAHTEFYDHGIAPKLVTRVQRLSWTAPGAEHVRWSGCGMRAVLSDEQRMGGARERFLRTPFATGDRHSASAELSER
jgi:hypothetical protein